jgi:hypothetical protein
MGSTLLVALLAVLEPGPCETDRAPWPEAVLAPRADLARDTVLVKIWDRVFLPSSLWDRAAQTVEGMFDDAGVAVRFERCGPTAEPDCSAPQAPRVVGLRLYRRSLRDTRKSRHDLGGATLITDGPGARAISYVFYDRLEEIARDERLPLELVLGLTIAHELGHALLPPGHSISGIMQARLGGREWKRAQRGWMLFTPEDAARMRDRLRASHLQGRVAVSPAF